MNANLVFQRLSLNQSLIETILKKFKCCNPRISLERNSELPFWVDRCPEFSYEERYEADHLEIVLEQILLCEVDVKVSDEVDEHFHEKEKNTVWKDFQKAQDRLWDHQYDSIDNRIYEWGDDCGSRKKRMKAIYELYPDLQELLETCVQLKKKEKKTEIPADEYLVMREDLKLNVTKNIQKMDEKEIIFFLKCPQANKIAKMVNVKHGSLTHSLSKMDIIRDVLLLIETS